jgi:hypothetical protein
MRSSYRFLPRLLGLIVILASICLVAPGNVSATTGPTDFLPPTKFHVPLAVQKLYIGQYILKSVDPASRLSGGAFGIEIDADTGYLVGIAQFSGYDQGGDQSTWEASMYNFDLTKPGQMIIDLLGPTGVPLFGRLYVTRTAKGDLHGQLTLGKSKVRYDISIQKLNSARPVLQNGA